MNKDQGELEALREEYLSQLRGLFPLYRAALLFVALVIVVAVQDSIFKSVSEGLLYLQLRTFVDFENGFFANVMVQDALAAISLLLLGTVMHRLLRLAFFLWLRKNLNINEVAKKMNDKSGSSRDGTIAGYFALKRSEVEASNWSKKISNLSLISESTLTLSLAFGYAGYYGNLIDFGVALVFLVCSLFALTSSFVVFLRHYLPHTMHVSGVVGRGGEIRLPE